MSPKRFPAEKVDTSPLGQPLEFTFSNKTAKNRFLKGSMSERLSSWSQADLPKRGIPSKELINVYRRWGEGGFGVLLTGNIMIEYDQLEATGNAIIPSDAPFSGERFEAFRELAAAAKAQGSLIVVQLSHPGRQVAAMLNGNPISASDVQLEGDVHGMRFAKPRAMDKEDFERVVESFAHAAEFSYKAGFDGIELHGAHGYLLAQFLAPSTNKRTDQYGGSLSNRSRLIFEINDAIRARIPDKSFTIGIKLNSVEFQDGGFSTEDCRTLCADLERHAFDFIELSGGTYESFGFEHKRESTRKREAFFLDFAEKIIPEVKNTKIYVTGGLRTAPAMVGALKTVHGVGLGRPVANEFDLPRKILDGEVNAAIDGLLDEQDFGITLLGAGTQMRLVGNDKQPLDMSREDHKNIFLSSLGQWVQAKKNGDFSNYGFVDIKGLEPEVYGTAYTAA